jgi:aminopeptidase
MEETLLIKVVLFLIISKGVPAKMTFSESRLSRIAQILVRYSLAVQPGQLVAVMAGVEAIPLVREVYCEILRAGAYPELQLKMDEADEIYLKEASDEQLSFVSPLKQLINERFDRLLYIGVNGTRLSSGAK